MHIDEYLEPVEVTVERMREILDNGGYFCTISFCEEGGFDLSEPFFISGEVLSKTADEANKNLFDSLFSKPIRTKYYYEKTGKRTDD